MKPLISVVVPTYNEEKNIVKCLKSLENQTIGRKKYEIIVVDGKSKDRTVSLARKHADRVVQQKSERVGGARNDGARIAKADIIATTDADCTVPGDWLENILKAFGDKKVVCVFGPIRPIEKTTKYKYMIFMNNLAAYMLHKAGIFNATIGSNTAFRKKEFIRVGGYSEIPACDDYEIALRIKKAGKIKLARNTCVNFSMRRLEKFGVMGTLVTWTLNSGKIITKKELTKINYNKQIYD